MSLYFSHLEKILTTALNHKPLEEITGSDRARLIQKICTWANDRDYSVEWTHPITDSIGQGFKILDERNLSEININFNDPRFRIDRDQNLDTKLYKFFGGTLVVFHFTIPPTSTGYREETILHKYHTKYLYITEKHRGIRKFYYAIAHTNEHIDIYSGNKEQSDIELQKLLGLMTHTSDTGSGRD